MLSVLTIVKQNLKKERKKRGWLKQPVAVEKKAALRLN